MMATSNTEKQHMTEECFAALKPLFQQYVDALTAKPPARASELPERRGLYALSEGGKYRYVGITGNLRGRWLGHRYGGSSAATLAIKFAREETNRGPAYTSAEGLKALLKTDEFSAAFKEAKKRIRRMDVRFLEWDGNDADLAVLEIYAARALKTRYNDFSPH